MEKLERSDGRTPEPVKNIHGEVPESFHRRIKMLCAAQGTTIRKYLLCALEEKVARDEQAMRRDRG